MQSSSYSGHGGLELEYKYFARPLCVVEILAEEISRRLLRGQKNAQP